MSASLMAPTLNLQPPVAATPLLDRLSRFLPAYWLRPENALWMTLRSAALAAVPFVRPSLDACCGDGVFSFLHRGGAFDPSFDVYCGVEGGAGSNSAPRDIYDCWITGYRPRVAVRPFEIMDAGSDWKRALLAKARQLGFYARLVEHDHHLPLPFGEGSFQTIYCNAAYWMRNVEALLTEFHRVLRPGGTLMLHVKLEAMRRCTLERHRAALGDEVLAILGGDRLECWPGLGDRQTWEKRFRGAGLVVKDARPFVTATHALLWYVGLRPIAPLLMRMVGALNEETRISIKKDWVDLFTTLLTPLCLSDVQLGSGAPEPVEIQYVLTRS